MILMKKLSMLRVLLLTVMLVFAMHALAFAGEQDFTFHNHSNKTIDCLYVSYAGENNWGPDILGREYLYPGESTGILIDGYDMKTWDIRVVFVDGTVEECYNFNLKKIVNVYYDGKTFWYN